MTSRELVKSVIEGNGAERLPLCTRIDVDAPNREIGEQINKEYESDILLVGSFDPEFVPVAEDCSEMGLKRVHLGDDYGLVLEPPLSDWANYESWKAHLPDYTAARRYEMARQARAAYPDTYLVGGINQMMELIISLRGWENYMTDFYEEEENLRALIDTLYTVGKQLVDGYADAGLDAVIAWEDWGLQHTPMMSHALWKDFFYEKMKDFVDHIHARGMKYILHSCGHILYLMDTFVEMGIDVIQLDQQNNMGLEELSKWNGKICFWAPVDIQLSPVMPREEMKEYVDRMVRLLGHEKGGFMYKAYAQPAAIRMSADRLRQEIGLMRDAWK